jgi:hypothetical protein
MRSSTTAKISTAIGTAALALCLAAGSGVAAPPKGSGGGAPHSAGGGAPHPAGGGGGGGVHFAPHVNVGRPAISHFAAPRVSHFTAHVSRPRVSRSIAHVGHVRPHVTTHLNGRRNGTRATVHNVTPKVSRNAANLRATKTRLTGKTDPHNFARLRRLRSDPTFRPFLAARWHRHHHLGWVGPLFWPYAYGDLFYCGIWPWDYCGDDAFWGYGYGDIYEGMFLPYDYSEYVQGPQAPERMAALTQSVAQSCDDEAAEVTGWPIDQIQSALSPNAQQTALLDGLGNAIVKASDVIKSHCPTTVAFAPTDRLAQMQERLEGMVQSVDIVQPALAKFYDSLSDEQKARFNDIGVPGGKPPSSTQQAAQNPQAECGQAVMTFPTDRIDQVVQPNDAQKAKLDALQAANTKAEDLIKASCPSELPATPPDRLAAEGQRLQAMLQAVQTIQPALADFYDSLSDEQKARFNNLGRQLFAEE